MICILPTLSERQLQTLSTSVCFSILVFATPIGWTLFFFLLTTRFWWLAILYSFWLYHDRTTPETGGRSNDWIQSWKCWWYYKNYFPANLIKPESTLNPQQNYLFSCFPHGILPTGPFHNISARSSEFRHLYPKFKAHMAILHWLFYTPFLRDLGLALGLVSCSAKSVSYVLSRPEGGQIVLLNPGGATETFNAGQEQYKFFVKTRKGFVKIALENGAALVPVITFGENELFRQFQNDKLRRVQEFVKKPFGFVPALFYGRGFTENSFGIVPLRRPLKTVLGTPIEVGKRENPTTEEIDLVHQKFLEELVRLFETHKNEFMENPQEALLLE
ncbi:hypothetical protein Zmor_001385 [Zophobas morio]|uniref:Acyltransferase n=1 Tax=Zophobas morio TaxID=2755281 RepID=A0AA38J552_9CUCU|nr:hypothetical protein Zmor_001385 [Zophobas morio]